MRIKKPIAVNDVTPGTDEMQLPFWLGNFCMLVYPIFINGGLPGPSVLLSYTLIVRD